MKTRKPIIGITVGDCNGIGPEITLKSIMNARIRKICTPVLIGPMDVYEFYAKKLKLPIHLQEIEPVVPTKTARHVPVMNVSPYRVPVITVGKLSEESGRFSGEAITRAATFCTNGMLDAMVTSPVSKEAMVLAGYRFPGQTEMLTSLTKSTRVAMMLIAGNFRVALATVHVPIKKVSTELSIQSLTEKIAVVHKSLRRDFAIHIPKIAILGLNPHAGENGMIGMEEQNVILPAIRTFQKKRIRVDGPFPADGFFGLHHYRNYDAVVAMYHDQGLIPLKMSGFHQGVNYSAGLNIVRTSPDHGTAFDIAGKGIANPGSMMEAISLAARIVLNRQ